ncbi:MAG: hypothetical protein WC548_01985 [Candidatus Pacearchaeota archaeon]
MSKHGHKKKTQEHTHNNRYERFSKATEIAANLNREAERQKKKIQDAYNNSQQRYQDPLYGSSPSSFR